VERFVSRLSGGKLIAPKMKHVFRTTRKYWWSEDGFILALFPIFAAGAYWLGNPVFLLCWLLMVLVSLPSHYRLSRARLEINEEGISVQEKKVVTNVSWSEVCWIKLVESWDRPKKTLEIGTSDGGVESSFQFPLDHFDHGQIWQLVEQFAPASALENDAKRKTSGYQDWAMEAAKAVVEVKKTLRVSDSWMIRIGSWFLLPLGLSVFWFLFVDPSRHQENDPYNIGLVIAVLGGLFASGIGLLGALNSGTTELNHEKIRRRTLLKNAQMRWDEITRIEEGAGEYAIYGRHKRLSLPSPGWWSGKSKWEAALFFQTQIELRGIEIKPMRSLFRHCPKLS